MSGRLRQAGRGFTLIELLGAVAIVILLVAMALPALSSGKAAAQQSRCASNLRQIGTALLAYAADNDGKLPTTSHSGGSSKSWIFTLAPYLDAIDTVRICPADPKGPQRLKGGTSYTLNSKVFVTGYDADGNPLPASNRLSLLDRPAQTLFATLVSDQKTGTQADHTHSEAWENWTSVLVDITPDRFRRGKAAADRTSGRSNYLYGDGHVETIEASRIKQLIDQGINPSDVP